MNSKKRITELEEELQFLIESNAKPDTILAMRLKINELRHELDHPDLSKAVWRGYVQ